VGGVDGSVYKGMELLVAGGMKYHRARSLTGKLSQVISESRGAIAKERNESARNARVEKQKEEREELRKEVKELWDRDRRSMTLRVKHPLAYYLESNKRMLTYRNVRRRAEERLCAREAREKRQADLRAQSQERARWEQRMADGTLVRQRTLAECLNTRRRVIHETDSDEEESGGVSVDNVRGSSSSAIHVAHCVHPDVLHPPRQLQVPTNAAARSAAAAATAAATATTPASSASAVAVAPPAMPAPDVLAAATSSTPGAGWLQRAGAVTKRQAKPKWRGQQNKPKRNDRQRDQSTPMIGNKRQRKESEVAETQVAAADEGDEGEAKGDSSGDSQGGDRQNDMDGDRQGGGEPIRRGPWTSHRRTSC
jgi:hypothetical protein